MHFRIIKQATKEYQMQHDKITRILWGATFVILGLFTLLGLIGHISNNGISEAKLESFLTSCFYVWLAVGIYLLPAFIALVRYHHNAASIFLVNLLLGWTFLGWVGALVWAVMPVQHNPSASAPVSIRDIGLDAVARELGR
jgi:cytoskeletal protein RodZ